MLENITNILIFHHQSVDSLSSKMTALDSTACGGRPLKEKTKNDSQEKKGLAKEGMLENSLN